MASELRQDSSENNQYDRNEEITLLDLFQMVHKHWIVGVIAFAIIFFGTCIGTLLMPVKYTASAQLFATYSGNITQNNYSEINDANVYVKDQIQSYLTLAKTEIVLEPAAEQVGLSESEIASQITVTNPSNTEFITITAVGEDANKVADVANAVANSLSNVVAQSIYADKNMAPVKISTVQPAAVPTTPSSPKASLNLAFGALAGVVIALLATILVDVLSTKIQDRFDLQQCVKAPVIGQIPYDAELRRNKSIIVSHSECALAEDFRRICVKLAFISPIQGTNARLIVITSGGPAEGKTTTSVNIATALAESGKEVLLIDADLRHPSIAHSLGLDDSVGLSHVLSRQIPVDNVVQTYWKPNLHILPAGPTPPNPASLLNSDIMSTIVERAFEKYDYVIIDTSSMLDANDAVTFTQKGGGLVIVARRGVTHKSSLKEIDMQLKAVNITPIGFVLTFTKPPKGSDRQ